MTQTVELEVDNTTDEEIEETLGQIKAYLEAFKDEEQEEFALVRLEPLSRDQHEANEALRKHLEGARKD